jgi:alkane 1-monooxygenase
VNRNYKYSWSLLPGILVICGNLLGGWWIATNVVFVFLVLTCLEFFLPVDQSNEHDTEDWFPDILLFVHALVQTACILSMFWTLHHNQYSIVQLLLLALSVGSHSGSSAIVIAHELIHRKKSSFRALGSYLLFTAGNIYFYVDHLKVHHKYVGTDADPATAKKGEHVYGFFMRSMLGQIYSSWKVESLRLKSVGKSIFSFSNYLVASVFSLLLLAIVLYFTLGWIAIGVFMLQVFFANFLLEYTNYIEHYGITRQPGERVTEHHSWQTDKVLSRYFLIDLSRHADHHYYASKPYHTLKSYEESPILPHGYVSMVFFALIPPLFFKVMHPLMSTTGRAD